MEYIIAVVLLMLLFALPDALRRKRRYPTRGKRRSSPIETKPTDRSSQVPGQRDDSLSGESNGQATMRKPQRPAPVPPRTQRRPVDQPRPQAKPQTASRPAAGTAHPTAPNRAAKTAQTPVPEPQPVAAASLSAATHYMQPAPWSDLSGTARDIYAGLVWSELLQKPVSMRQKR